MTNKSVMTLIYVNKIYVCMPLSAKHQPSVADLGLVLLSLYSRLYFFWFTNIIFFNEIKKNGGHLRFVCQNNIGLII